MLDPQDRRGNRDHKEGWVLLVHQDVSSADPRVTLAQVVLLVRWERLAMDFQVQRVTEVNQA